ncbi:hypothetical protein V6N11_047404 [Hibiscus sabdariffa]|uniref:H15 domain-containing protein n=1 Tax=Hibiscus sabdariffa TaxID=183260 RepID=A0ABR2A590_9ROSI
MATEEPSVEVDAAPETAEEKPEETKPKKAAAPKKPRGPSTHPPWEEMIRDAISSLKERMGSSQYAIAKFIEEKHKQLPGNFKKFLLFHLKRFVAAGKLIKVKNSYKLPPVSSSKPAGTSSAPAQKKPAVTKTKSKPASKAKEGKSAKPDSKAPAKTKTASKPKIRSAAKPKAAPKAKSAPTKTKAVASVKPNTTAAKPTKAARTSTRTSPGKKAAAAPKPSAKKAPAAKKATAKSVKPKTVKSPAKRGRK